MSNVKSIKEIDLTVLRKPVIGLYHTVRTTSNTRIIAMVKDRGVTLYTLEYLDIKEAVDDIQKNWRDCKFCLRGTDDVARLIGVFV